MYIGLLEDDPHIAQDVCDLLEGAGHKVRDFDNGGEMISALSRDTLDLFVLDWWVPEKTGIQVLAHIRGTLGLTTPVLFLTSRSDEKDIVAALNAGADDYCTKPIQSQVLLARIAALLRRTYPEHDSKAHKEFLGYAFNPADQTVSPATTATLIRAYNTADGSGDEGAGLSLDLTKRISDAFYFGALYDYGWVRLAKNPLPATTTNTYNLQGAGLQFGGAANRFNWNMSVAKSFGDGQDTRQDSNLTQVGDWRINLEVTRAF